MAKNKGGDSEKQTDRKLVFRIVVSNESKQDAPSQIKGEVLRLFCEY